MLNVIIIEAKDLEAKDSDGFSDPYCMLGIKPGQQGIQASSQNQHLTASRAASTPQHSPSKHGSRGSLRRR